LAKGSKPWSPSLFRALPVTHTHPSYGVSFLLRNHLKYRDLKLPMTSFYIEVFDGSIQRRGVMASDILLLSGTPYQLFEEVLTYDSRQVVEDALARNMVPMHPLGYANTGSPIATFPMHELVRAYRCQTLIVTP
jgi:hypothetical protein